MRRLRRFGLLLLLCVCCAAVIKVLAFDSRGGGAETDKGEETIVGWMIERMADGEIDLSDEESIRQAIAEGEGEFDITLKEETKDRVVGFMRTLDTVETGADDFAERAKRLYEKYGTEFVEQANDTINGAFKDAAEDAVHSFFESILSKKDE